MRARSKIPFAKKLKKILLPVLGLALFLIAFSIGLFFYYSLQIPDPVSIASRRINESTKIFDRSGQNILYDIHAEEKRTVIPWDQIPDYIKKATLAAEDKDFYSHSGVDFTGILRALYNDALSLSASQGGSTITQQLIKKTLLSDEKSLSRKIKEAALAFGVEKNFTKDQIFWMYLNQIPYGSNNYGVEAASQNFFSKPAKDLTLAEAATLASLPKAPTYYSPYGSHTDDLLARRNYVLQRMKDLGYTSDSEYNEARNTPLGVTPSHDSISAPHFVIMIKDYLVNKYGEDAVDNGGLQVTTTLDSKIQTEAEDSVSKYAQINKDKYKASNAALTAIDPKTGQILAMVGSVDYFDVKNDGNYNVATASRQPGSSFKPFAYAEAFRKGFTDSTVLFDVKTEFNPSCPSSADQTYDPSGQKCYHPQDYDGSYRGPVTMRQALDESLNIPSVKTLYLAGLDDTIDLAQNMGITTLQDRSRLGLSLVLGGGEVRLLDMVSAYGAFANDGLAEKPSFILKVTTSDGSILEEYKKDEKKVLDPQIARLISDVLSDNNARSPVFGFNSPLYIPGRQVAAKTGTTQENRDGWLIGYTQSLVAGVWTGNNDNSPMTRQGAGISAAGPMWQDFMIKALADTPLEEFPKPDPIITEKPILNGQYAGLDGIQSILYYVDKENPAGPPPANPASDPQFNNWQSAINTWLSR